MAPQLAVLAPFPPVSNPLAGGHRQHLTSTPIKKFSQKNTPRMWAELRRSLRSPEENIEVPPISARPEYCGASESGVCLFAFLPYWYYDEGLRSILLSKN